MTELSESNEWWTTWDLFKQIEAKYRLNFRLDAAASKLSTKCEFYITKKQNALTTEWVVWYPDMTFYDKVDTWLNPPLGKTLTKQFVLRAFEQWKKYDMNLVMLLPAGVISRKYFKPIWDLFKNSYTTRVDIEPVRPRPSFLYMGKPVKDTARNDYITVFLKRNID